MVPTLCLCPVTVSHLSLPPISANIKYSVECSERLHFHFGEVKWQPTPVFLPGESQGWRSLVGCRLWGRTESDTTEAT